VFKKTQDQGLLGMMAIFEGEFRGTYTKLFSQDAIAKQRNQSRAAVDPAKPDMQG
jgi:hypothetical protein